jgi:leader peptidase (prepilin peptidase) / N-methyltransferase
MLNSLEPLVAALGIFYLLAVSWALARTDIRERRLPNKFVLPAFPITLLGQLLAGIVFGNWLAMLFGFVCGLVAFLTTLWLNRIGALGMGDVKLITVMALALGWYSPFLPLVALLFTFLTAGLVATFLFLTKRLQRGGSMPLGPYLILGFLSSITAGVWS